MTQTSPPADQRKTRVTYLLGAGATQASADAASVPAKTLMKDLTIEILKATKRKLSSEPSARVKRLLNDVGLVSDFEQLITFLADSPASELRDLSTTLRSAFVEVLKGRMELIDSELAGSPDDLYRVLMQMHQHLPDEELVGFLTLNYDTVLQRAIEAQGSTVDPGIRVDEAGARHDATATRVVCLHGSFGWASDWPIPSATEHSEPLWIPPGIRKSKVGYPFNLLWGLAQELLDCDVLRVVGCNIGKNDWDLISLVFTTRLGHRDGEREPYEIELIDFVEMAEAVKVQFPYFHAKTLLELDEIGSNILGGLRPKWVGHRYDDLDEAAQKEARKIVDKGEWNPFRDWLKRKIEMMNTLHDLPVFQGQAEPLARFLGSR